MTSSGLSPERLFQHALRYREQQNMRQLWVTPDEAGRWFDAIRVCVPSVRIPMNRPDQQRLRHEVLAQWEAALSRAMRRARLSFLTEQPLLESITRDHANFPMQTLPDGSRRMGYRVEAMLAQDVVKSAVEALRKSLNGARLKPQGWEHIVGALREEVGEIDLKDTLAHVLKALDAGADADTFGLPLPRLHIPQHLYSPLLLAAPAAQVEAGEQLSLMDEQPVTLRISPPPLESPDGHPNSPTCGHLKFPHPERGVMAG